MGRAKLRHGIEKTTCFFGRGPSRAAILNKSPPGFVSLPGSLRNVRYPNLIESMNVVFAWLNGWEILAIMVVILILFGAKRLPELAKGLGQGIKEFKKSSREITDEIQQAIDTDSPPPAPKRVENSASTGTAADSTAPKAEPKTIA